MTPATASDQEQIRRILRRINDAWLVGPAAEIPQRLADCFHDQIAMRGPEFQELAGGRDACAKSYQDFLQQATIQDCKLEEPRIHVTGGTAVATYGWDMTYELNSQVYTESGHDLFVFTGADGKWLAVWRALLPSR
jgi:ketosteroid isomerase-like protein